MRLIDREPPQASYIGNAAAGFIHIYTYIMFVTKKTVLVLLLGLLAVAYLLMNASQKRNDIMDNIYELRNEVSGEDSYREESRQTTSEPVSSTAVDLMTSTVVTPSSEPTDPGLPSRDVPNPGQPRTDAVNPGQPSTKDAARDTNLRVTLDSIMDAIPKEVKRRKFPACTPEECAAQVEGCWCSWLKGPKDIPPSKRPQIVIWTFDDHVTERRMETLRRLKLLGGERKNPNGCPVSATFFVSDFKRKVNNYTLVRDLYLLGHEIASHSASHSTNYDRGSKEFWKEEMVTMRDNLHKFSGIPMEELRGMRAPYLDAGGDNQFAMIEENGFEWDSSIVTPGYHDGQTWPFPMGHRFGDCWNENCPQFHMFKGFWEVPVGRWLAPDSEREGGCHFADMCENLPVDEKDTRSYFWKNFLTAYRGSRAPFPLFFHAVTFEDSEPNGAIYLRVLNEFLDHITQLEDVYLVTISQLLEWMKKPQTAKQAKTFSPWLRSCSLDSLPVG